MSINAGTISSFLLKSLGWIGVFLLPIKPTMISVSFLVLADLIVGILAAHKQGQKIESGKLRSTVSKTVAYQLGLITSLVMQQQFMPELPIIKIVAGLIAVSETKSIFENIEAITGIPLKDFVMQYLQPPKDPPKQ